ncbi:hypothetical protein Dsin_032388 [Dipteronia sinensis]|uniref:Uncharacterized protein n=1 Tax=Dipteronia sinensis TaxID=43782 RepID=A0AAE0DTB3_9ROSI|nr:hypothetical protein Dsin_032388 [Dipteronia sinensis]
MSKTNSWVNSYKLQSFLELFYRNRSACSTLNSPASFHRFEVAKVGHGYSMHQSGLQLISNNGTIWRKQNTTMVKVKDDIEKVGAVPAGPSPPPRFNFFLWARWILGSLLTLFLPLWKQKLNQFQKIEGEAEMVVEEVEKIAEVVEKVASAAEKLSEEVADAVPDNHPKVKDTALFVERFSKATANDAQLTLNVIHKVLFFHYIFNPTSSVLSCLIFKNCITLVSICK